MKVYLASRWEDRQTRVIPMANRLEAIGVQIAHKWWDVEAERGPGPESELDEASRWTYAYVDYKSVRDADVLWLLAPETGGRGCWFELGAAYSNDVYVIVSGPGRLASIFTSLASERWQHDEEAFRAVLDLDSAISED